MVKEKARTERTVRERRATRTMQRTRRAKREKKAGMKATKARKIIITLMAVIIMKIDELYNKKKDKKHNAGLFIYREDRSL